MSHALLVGLSSPNLISISSVLHGLGCAAVWSPPHIQREGDPQWSLIVVDYWPDEMSVGAFQALLTSYWAWPILVTGPELPTALLATHGAAAYLAANTSPARKVAVLRRYLQPPQTSELHVGALRMNSARTGVRYKERAVDVTSTELRLLRVMMQVPGQYMDCRTLTDLGACHAVSTHLRNARRKLAAHAAGFMLRGDPTHGYTIDARVSPRQAPDATFALKHHLLHLL